MYLWLEIRVLIVGAVKIVRRRVCLNGRRHAWRGSFQGACPGQAPVQAPPRHAMRCDAICDEVSGRASRVTSFRASMFNASLNGTYNK